MNAARLPLFCDTALAERIERVEAQLVTKGSEAAGHRAVDSAGFVIHVAGGVASFTEEGSPLNKVAGLGFGGVPTSPAHRRRGVQTALLSTRLADTTTAGCDIAVITTQPGSKSQQNAQCQGVNLLYTRAILVKLPTRRNAGQRGAGGAP